MTQIDIVREMTEDILLAVMDVLERRGRKDQAETIPAAFTLAITKLGETDPSIPVIVSGSLASMHLGGVSDRDPCLQMPVRILS